MVSTEAQKRASKAAHEKKLRDGYKRQWFYISAEGQAAFAELLKAHGTQIAAVNHALIDAAAALTAPPVQDAKAGPESAIESMQARRAKGPERPKTLSPTLPAGDPVKAASEPQKRLSVDVQIGPRRRKPGEMLKTPKGSKR